MNKEEKKAIEYSKNCLMKITMGIDCEFDVNILDALINIIKKLQKENEELNEKILDNAGIYQLGFKDGEESYIKKVKDKIEELIKEGRHYNANKIEVLQELLEEEK